MKLNDWLWLWLGFFIIISFLFLIGGTQEDVKELRSRIEKFEKSNNDLKKEIVLTQDKFRILILLYLKDKKPEKVTVSAYTPSEDECDSTPHITASMRKTRPGWTAACSDDLMDKFFNRIIYIPNQGIWKVTDRMNSRFTNCIDICKGTKAEAFAFGRQTVNVYLAD